MSGDVTLVLLISPGEIRLIVVAAQEIQVVTRGRATDRFQGSYTWR